MVVCLHGGLVSHLLANADPRPKILNSSVNIYRYVYMYIHVHVRTSMRYAIVKY